MASGEDDIETATAKGSDPALDATVPADSDKRQPHAQLAPGEKIGRYEISEVLGSGGMGVVYRARDPELDRDLAIKVVRPGTTSERAQQRLLAEARAMAKLRHPAVVPVFDVGATNDGVFIVMPLIRGGTMHEWMRERRPWNDVVNRFLTAGRGLAAAHAAGLIHRDFKPRNVLMGDAGEVLVADFGIAARADGSSDTLRDASPGTAQVSSIAGTPAYMAPEQADGVSIDARADQYSFCVSFWEALCGERPTEAETRTRSAVSVPSRPGASKRTEAPGWLLASIARGFSASSAERWPSMETLLGHIDRRRHRPRRVAIIAALVALPVLAIAGVTITRSSTANPCPDPAPRLARVWSPAIRAEIETAFAATQLPYASDAVMRIVPVLDRYASSWRTTTIATCKAARVERTQSEVLFARRRHCLERRFAALAGRSDAFRHASKGVVEAAIDSVESLPELTDCDDVEKLLAYAGEPDPTKRTEIAVLDHKLDEIEAMESRGLVHERVDAAADIVKATGAIDYPPLHARALYLYSAALVAADQPVDAIARETAQVAALAREDAIVADAWIDLIHDLSARQNKLDEAAALEPVAEAAVVRVGSPPQLVWRFESARMGRAMAADDYANARLHAQRAVDISPTPTRRADALYNLANALAAMGEYKDALPAAEEALRQMKESRGEFHPDTADQLVLVAQLLGKTGGYDRQEELLARAIDIQRRSLGTDSKKLGRTLIVFGNLKRVRGALDESETLLREAVTVMEKVDDKQALATAVGSLADTLSKSKGLDQAKAHYLRTMTLLEEVGGKEQLLYVMIESNFANRYVDAGDCATARPYFEHARAFLETHKHPGVVMATTMLAQCDLKDGKLSEAIAAFERAAETCRAKGCQPGALQEILFTLGTTLVETHRDRARGIALVRESRAGYEKIGNAAKLKTVDDWLAKHAK